MEEKKNEIIHVKVIPRAKKTEFIGYMSDGSMKIRLKAVPENGKANEELVRFLSEYFQITSSQIQVTAGQTNSRKTLRITR
jgi:uncharacterized protein (TIGR00251 family)